MKLIVTLLLSILCSQAIAYDKIRCSTFRLEYYAESTGPLTMKSRWEVNDDKGLRSDIRGKVLEFKKFRTENYKIYNYGEEKDAKREIYIVQLQLSSENILEDLGSFFEPRKILKEDIVCTRTVYEDFDQKYQCQM